MQGIAESQTPFPPFFSSKSLSISFGGEERTNVRVRLVYIETIAKLESPTRAGVFVFVTCAARRHTSNFLATRNRNRKAILQAFGNTMAQSPWN